MQTPSTVLLQINPRLDGCIRAWNLMNQGHSGVKEVIQEKQSKHCLVAVGRGSFYPGTGMAKFQINYSKYFCCLFLFFLLDWWWNWWIVNRKEKKKRHTHTLSYTPLYPVMIPATSGRNLLEWEFWSYLFLKCFRLGSIFFICKGCALLNTVTFQRPDCVPCSSMGKAVILLTEKEDWRWTPIVLSMQFCF